MITKNKPFSIFNKFDDIKVAISEKRHGSMKLCDINSHDFHILNNIKQFLAEHKIELSSLVMMKVTHENNILSVTQSNCSSTIVNCDGLITNERGVYLSLTVADCLPIILYDQKKKIISLIHAGWRGLLANIAFKAVEKLSVDYKSDVKDIVVAIGPGIDVCHFEVKEDVYKKFAQYSSSLREKNGRLFVNLKNVAQIQLFNAGISKANLEISHECTYCLANKYFSRRRDKNNCVKCMLVLCGNK